MRHVYLIRHGQAQAGESGMDRDFFLSDTGRLQVNALARQLRNAGVQPAMIFSSCLTRARQTAAILSETLPAPVLFRRDLIEHGSGVYLEDCSLIEAGQRYPNALTEDGVLKTWNPDGCVSWDFTIGGESVRQLHARALAAWNTILAEMPGGQQPVLIVSHGSFLSAMLTEILQLSLSGMWRFSFANAGVVSIGLHIGTNGKQSPILSVPAPHVTPSREAVA